VPLGVVTPVSPGTAKVTLRTTEGLTNCAAFAGAATGVGLGLGLGLGLGMGLGLG